MFFPDFAKTRDIVAVSRDAGHLSKKRDCPAQCGTDDTSEIGQNTSRKKR